MNFLDRVCRHVVQEYQRSCDRFYLVLIRAIHPVHLDEAREAEVVREARALADRSEISLVWKFLAEQYGEEKVLLFLEEESMWHAHAFDKEVASDDVT